MMIDINNLVKAEDKIAGFSEDQLQAYIYKKFHNVFTDFRKQLFSVPNGGKRDKREANKLKATGLVSGIPDLVFFAEETLIFFELKTGSGSLSPNQLILKLIINNNNIPYFLVRTPDQFFYGLITKLMERKLLNTQKAIKLFRAIQEGEDLIFFGLTEKEFLYEIRIFQYIFEMEAEDEKCILKLTSEETREDFIKAVKKFIHLEFDVSNNFQITFNEDFTKFVKICLF